MTFKSEIKQVLDQLTKIMREELATTDPGRFKRVRRLCGHANLLLREIATSVEDFEALDEDEEGGELPVLRSRRRRRGIALPGDNVEMIRGALMGLAEQNKTGNDRNQLRAAELLVSMKERGLDEDPQLGKIYEVVSADVLRGLQTRTGGGEDLAEDVEGDRPGEEATGGVQGSSNSPRLDP